MHIHTIQLNIEKLAGGTVHMDATEFGAYMSLIIACYQANNSLPDNDERLSRMSRVTLKVWKRIKPTISEKFLIIDGKWSHDVVQKELAKYSSLSTKNKANRLKGKQRRSPVVNQPSDQTATNTSNNNQVTSNSKKDSGDLSALFENFWSIYPKQRAGSKEKAKEALVKALTRDNELNIMKGLRAYSASDEVARGYAKGAAAWLNDDRWQTKYQTEGQKNEINRNGSARPSKTDRAKSAVGKGLDAIPNPKTIDDEGRPEGQS